VCSLKYGKYNFDNFNVVFYSLTTFVPNGQFVYFHFKSLITKFVFFVSMHKFCIAYVQVVVLKVIFCLFAQIHTVVMHGFRENSNLVYMIPLMLKP
jgi:hypothetical protein